MACRRTGRCPFLTRDDRERLPGTIKTDFRNSWDLLTEKKFFRDDPGRISAIASEVIALQGDFSLRRKPGEKETMSATGCIPVPSRGTGRVAGTGILRVFQIFRNP